MQNALLVIHLMVAAALVTVVLFQQSEGGALGMGGGGGGGGFMTGRGVANVLTRVTAGLALAFFCTSILLTILANRGSAPASILAPLNAPAKTAPARPGSPAKTSNKPAVPSGGGGLLDALKSGRGHDRLPKIPQGQ